MSRLAPKVPAIALALLFVMSPTGISHAQDPVTVTDANGDAVVISDASRVVTLGGVVTEIAFALGAQDQVVAVDESSSYPPEALAEKPSIGYYRFLSAEPVLATDPTLILGGAETGPPEVVSQLRDAGVTMVLLDDPKSLDGARELITAMGVALGRGPEAQAVVTSLDEEVAAAGDLVSRASDTPNVLFYFRPPGAPSLVAGTGTAADEMISLAGGKNAFASFDGYLPLTPEGIAAAAPDVILTTDASLTEVGGMDGLLAEPGIAETPAAADGRIVSMDDLYLLGFGPRTGQAITDLARLLHPELAE